MSKYYFGNVYIGGTTEHLTIKKMYILEKNRFILKRVVDGSDQIVDLDLRHVIPGDYQIRNHQGIIHIQVGVDEGGNMFTAGQIKGSNPAHEHRSYRVPTNADTLTYPYYIYTDPGESKTLEDLTHAVTLDWLPTETPEERKARIKREKIADWKARLCVIAKEYADQNRSQDWAHEHGHGWQAKPSVCLDLDHTNADHMPYIKHADNISVHLPKTIGIAWRAISLYESINNASFFDIGEESKHQWATRREYKRGDYKRGRAPNLHTYICLKDHSSTSRTMPGTGTPAALEHWSEALRIVGVPSGVNITTGDGIENLVKKVEQEFTETRTDDRGRATVVYEEVHFLWHAMMAQQTAWDTAYDKREVRELKVTSRENGSESASPGAIIYKADDTPVDASRAIQVEAAGLYADQDWVDLFRHQFWAARKYCIPTDKE